LLLGVPLTVDAWLESLPARHTGAMTRPEFLKAIRALSARYVERRGTLPDRSAIDSPGKRAAFAGFYAPLHFLTARDIIGALGGAPEHVASIVDAGCGTGVAGAAWATASARPPSVLGIDLSGWALDEARVTWRTLGLRGRTMRGNFVVALERLAADQARAESAGRTGIVLGWSLNELNPSDRMRADRAVASLAVRGAPVLVIEPVSRQLVPWWSDWAARCVAAGARADEWRLPTVLPPVLAALDRDAGFDRDALTARSVAFNWRA
jgi:hypothetical protein